MSIFKLLGKTLGKAVINGKSYTCNSTIIIRDNGDIMIDGATVSVIQGYEVKVEIEGDVQGSIATTSGDISIRGNCEKVRSTSGDIEAETVHGDAETTSGDISSRSILGDCRTVSGDIRK